MQPKFKFDLNNIRNPIFTVSGDIDCEINHPEFGWISFTASANDCEPMGRTLFDMARKGAFGDVAPYSAPVLTDEQVADQARSQRDQLLLKLDTVVTNPLRWNGLAAEQQQALSDYRQLLLDVPQQSQFPQVINWPPQPDFI